MSFRECALNNSSFIALKQAYDDREKVAREWKAAGKTVIGTMGNDVPDEVLIAAGMLPVRIYGSGVTSTENAAKFLELNFDQIVRCQFEKLVNGEYAELFDKVVISSSTDVLIRIYSYIREIHRTEPDVKVPKEYFVDILFTPYLQHQLRNEFVVDKFIKTVGEWAGHEISDEDLRRASAICNEDRQAMREFSALRYGEQPRVMGTEALVVIGSSLFMEKDKHAALVRELLKDAVNWPVVDAPRIYMTGSVQENLALYGLIEELGGNVITEDHDWGDRHFDTDVDLNAIPVKAIAARYMCRMVSPKKSFIDDHVAATVAHTKKTGAQGLLLYSIVEDETFAWDYPNQREALADIGVKTTAIGRQGYPLKATDELKAELKGFIDQLKEVK